MYLRRRERAEQERRESQAEVPVCGWTTEYPAVWEFLTRCDWGDGQPRQPGTMLLFVHEETLRPTMCLTDRDQHLVAFISARTITEALRDAERGLEDDTLDWRVKKESRPVTGTKKRR